MPFIDVTDVLLDPDFCETFTFIRSTVGTNSFGEGYTTETSTTQTGVITQGGGDILDRTGDAEKIRGSITIHTMFGLTAGDGTTGADEIVWNGRRYIVDNVSDWSTYGAGFTSASCTLKPLHPTSA